VKGKDENEKNMYIYMLEPEKRRRKGAITYL